MLGSPGVQGHPTEAQHGAGERGKRNTPRTHNARGGKRNDTTKTKKNKKRATRARKETGAHGIGSETNMGTPTPQREETNRPTAPPQARAHPAQASKAMRERESRERAERRERRVQINPRSRTTRGLQRDRGDAYPTTLNTPTMQVQVYPQLKT